MRAIRATQPLSDLLTQWLPRGSQPHSRLVAAALLVALITGGLLARSAGQAAPPSMLIPGQLVTSALVLAAQQGEGVAVAAGGYMPGSGITLYSRVERGDRALVRSWAASQLSPFAERLQSLAAKEKLVWIIDYPTEQQEILQVLLSQAADPTKYRYLSGVGMPAPVRAPAALALSAAPTAPPPPLAPPDDRSDLEAHALEERHDRWALLSGDWGVEQGTLVQRDQAGYDHLAILQTAPLTRYRVSVRMRLDAGKIGGVIYHMPDPRTRHGAQVVDFADGGATLRWGRYTDAGSYVYEGGVAIDPTIMDGGWHTLELAISAETTAISVDGQAIRTITNKSTIGNVGLTTSLAQVSFDDMHLTNEEAMK